MTAQQTQQQVALVTGAGDGIGRAIAARLARDGSAVVVSDISEEKGSETVAAITAEGGTASFKQADAGSADDHEALVQYALDTYGRLDAAINNAGLGHRPTPLHEITPEVFERAMGVTYRGTFFGMRAQLKHFTQVGAGKLVNIISIGGLQASKYLSGYISAKHAVVGLTQTAALEYASAGIRINGVAPGPIRTAAFATLPPAMLEEQAQQVPLGRLGEPEDIAGAVSWLLSPDADFVQGVVLPVDGGTLIA